MNHITVDLFSECGPTILTVKYGIHIDAKLLQFTLPNPECYLHKPQHAV